MAMQIMQLLSQLATVRLRMMVEVAQLYLMILSQSSVTLGSILASMPTASGPRRLPTSLTGGVVKTTEDKYPVALTQEHNSMYGRALAREISTDDVAGKGGFEDQLENVKKQGMDSHAPPNISLYKPEGSETWSKTELAKKTHLADEIHQWEWQST
jgi:hypothetical protein